MTDDTHAYLGLGQAGQGQRVAQALRDGVRMDLVAYAGRASSKDGFESQRYLARSRRWAGRWRLGSSGLARAPRRERPSWPIP